MWELLLVWLTGSDIFLSLFVYFLWSLGDQWFMKWSCGELVCQSIRTCAQVEMIDKSLLWSPSTLIADEVVHPF
ncbi:hypothetical protein O6P43_015987 [Quillaja saponaria]|uniref:Uncharacterized protein n=1 Tax=Quillaja saponaria TaxID=32244 RepID=A0AAD7LYD6_QUISA|nr:hypothetical protein O6P43_015987 [Quillaja saponaria]